jgi:hypothetical protein
MGVPPGANVILARHSLGGMVAQNLPVLPELGYNQRWKTVRVITFGSPIMNQLRLPDSITRRFAVWGDPVVTQASYWAAKIGFKSMFFPPDISGWSRKPIWIDGGPGFLDPIGLHLAYPNSFDLKGYDALGDQPGSQVLQLDAAHERQWATDFSQSTANERPWVVRGGVATSKQLQAGTAKHRGVPDPPGLYGFSVQYQPGKTIQELAAAGKFRNPQISVTTDAALVAAGVAAGYAVSIVKSPGAGYHHTVQVPLPLPLDLAVALSAVFTQAENPARFLGP